MVNMVFYCCGKSFEGAYNPNYPPRCRICGKHPKGYKKGQLRPRKRNLNYVPVALRVKIKVIESD